MKGRYCTIRAYFNFSTAICKRSFSVYVTNQSPKRIFSLLLDGQKEEFLFDQPTYVVRKYDAAFSANQRN